METENLFKTSFFICFLIVFRFGFLLKLCVGQSRGPNERPFVSKRSTFFPYDLKFELILERNAAVKYRKRFRVHYRSTNTRKAY